MVGTPDTPDQWLQLADAHRFHAAALQGDAMDLFERGRFGHAWTVAVRGMQEVGAYQACVFAAMGMPAHRNMYGDPERLLLLAKFASLTLVETDVSSDLTAVVDSFLAEGQSAMLLGQTVRWEDGRVREPSDVSEEAAQHLILIQGELVRVLEEHDLTAVRTHAGELDTSHFIGLMPEATPELGAALEAMTPEELRAWMDKVMLDALTFARKAIRDADPGKRM